jgi:hypothetical protein
MARCKQTARKSTGGKPASKKPKRVALSDRQASTLNTVVDHLMEAKLDMYRRKLEKKRAKILHDVRKGIKIEDLDTGLRSITDNLDEVANRMDQTTDGGKFKSNPKEAIDHFFFETYDTQLSTYVDSKGFTWWTPGVIELDKRQDAAIKAAAKATLGLGTVLYV